MIPKKIILFVFVLLLSAVMQAQTASEPDSLRRMLQNARHDTTRAQALIDLGLYYQEKDRDSSLHYAEELINLSGKMKLPILEAAGLFLKSYTIYHQRNILAAYKLANEGLAIARDEKNGKKQWIPSGQFFPVTPEKFRLFIVSSFVSQLGHIYYTSGNTDKAVECYKESLLIVESLKNKESLINANMNIGTLYIEQNKLDSGLVYSTRALHYCKETGNIEMMGAILQDIGDINFKKGRMDSAKQYYLRAVTINKKQNFRLAGIYSNLALAKYYDKAGPVDSLKYYATVAFALASDFRQVALASNAASLLAKSWKLQGNADSAYAYLLISKTLKDSITTVMDKQRSQFQYQNFEEQLKMEMAARESIAYRNKVRTIALVTGLVLFSLTTFLFYRNNRQKQKANKVLGNALENLKATQSQLIQSEKMASLGELTAGIAHEIQNPLNFVNNFSEVSNELVDEMNQELTKGDVEEAKAIASGIKQNLEKINHHGKRADAIVKGMLQHGRSSSGKKEPTDINALADEYLRLAYHGLRARDKSFNATLKTDYDESIGTVNLIPQDVGRVILNLITNAFYAVGDKKKDTGTNDSDNPESLTAYDPTVSVSTKKAGGTIEIKVADNGAGIPQPIIDKIFQPFFTTKPTGQGTGLGLSLAYDIVKAHGGELTVQTKEGEGSCFTIIIPTQ